MNFVPTAKFVVAVTVDAKVLTPTMVCAPNETKPGLVASAAVRVRVVPLIVPPFAKEDEVVYVNVFTPEPPADETQFVPSDVSTFPAAPGDVNPVPPFETPIAVALQTPEVMVPTVVKLAKDVNVVLDVAVIFPAVVAVVALPKKLGAVISFEKVLAPAKVCIPLVTIPPFVASAGVKVNTVPLMVAPFALEVPAIGVKVLTPAVIEVELALVILPFVSTVKTGIAVEDPYVPDETPDAAKVATPVTSAVPSKLPLI